MLVFDDKITVLEALKPFSARSFTNSGLALGIREHSMSRSRRFLHIKAENYNSIIAALRLHYLNILESSKTEVTVAGSIAFLIIMSASLHNARLKYLNYFAYPVYLLGVDWKNIREFIFPKKTPKKITGKVPYRFVTKTTETQH
ncbi:hypothetical protein TNCV_2611201 [Trichonephila clavipes]|nr:hypothetical protein TNCV_2611201 [Trichonephila clavipes]